MDHELHRLIERLEQDVRLFEPEQLRLRIETLDLLDACFADAGSHAPGLAPDGALSAADFCRRASVLRQRLEAANELTYEGIRAQIRCGQGRESLLLWARRVPEHADSSRAGGLGYGFLDELISGVFRFEDPGCECAVSDPEMVAYQPTPAQQIFDLIEAAELTGNDVLIDLGSGLGHVPLLVSICTSARTIGIELEASYVERACQCTQALNLGRVAFIRQDAREADLSAGTVFYLYTPFTGSILRDVLDCLRSEAGRRPIRIGSYGPCTPVIAQESWLEAVTLPSTHRISLFSSRFQREWAGSAQH